MSVFKPTSSVPIRVLHIEDDASIRQCIASYLKKRGFLRLDSDAPDPQWPAEAIRPLQSGADMIGAHLAHRRATQAREKSIRRYRALFEESPVALLDKVSQFEIKHLPPTRTSSSSASTSPNSARTAAPLPWHW